MDPMKTQALKIPERLLRRLEHVGVSQNWGYPFGDPHNKDYNTLGSILGSPYFGKLPYTLLGHLEGVSAGYGRSMNTRPYRDQANSRIEAAPFRCWRNKLWVYSHPGVDTRPSGDLMVLGTPYNILST